MSEDEFSTRVQEAMSAHGVYPRAILADRAYDHRENAWDIIRTPDGVEARRRHRREQ